MSPRRDAPHRVRVIDGGPSVTKAHGRPMGRAICDDCPWRGPWAAYVHTTERHRAAHSYAGRHRAE